MAALSVAQPIIEKFVETVCAQLSQSYLAASFLPWNDDFTFQPDAARVLFPPFGSQMFAEDELKQSMAGKKAVIIGCTFDNPEEEIAACRMFHQLARFQDVCKVVMHVLPPDKIQKVSDVKAAYDRMLQLGVDDLIVEPDLNEPCAVSAAIRLSVVTWQRVKTQCATFGGFTEKVKEVQDQHRRLLWEGIPRCLMPQIPSIDKSLGERPGWVGHYHLGNNLSSPHVLQAFDALQANQSVAIKVVDKSSIFKAQELEEIYRELRFVTGVLNHPNIIQGLCVLHATSKLYCVLAFAGSQNLEDLLQNLPGQRLQHVKLIEIFKQAVSGIAYCHSQDVVHRNLSLRHVVVQETDSSCYQIKLCDFRKAMVANPRFVSKTNCGKLPFAAPEALNEDHIPMTADCWSMGVLLLEMGGGLGTFFKAIDYANVDSAPDLYKVAVATCVNKQGFLVGAWTCMGAESNTFCCQMLMTLLRVQPQLRGSMASVLQVMEAEHAEIDQVEIKVESIY